MKNFWLYLNVVGLIISTAICDAYHDDDWVDLNDIMNYDRGTKSMISRSKERVKTDECSSEEHIHQILEFKEKLSDCKNVLLRMKRSKSNTNLANISKPSPQPVESSNIRASSIEAKEVLYIKRFINILLEASGLDRVTLKPNQWKEVNVLIKVNFEQLKKLQSFNKHEGVTTTLEEINDVLSEALQSLGSQYYLREELSNIFPSADSFYRLSHYVIVITISLLLLYRRRKSEIVGVIIVVLLAADYTWTSDYLIKMHEIKKFVTVQRNVNVPKSCLGEWSFMEYVLSPFRTPQDCTEYYMAKMMPSTLQVTPGMVVSEMFSTLIIHPMGKLGVGISKFSAGVLGSLGYFMGPVVLSTVFLSFTIAVVVIVVLSCGGRIRLPLFLGELSGPRIFCCQLNPLRHLQSPSRVEEIPTMAKSVTYITNHFHANNPTPLETDSSDILTRKSLMASASSIKETFQDIKMNVAAMPASLPIESDHFLNKIVEAFDKTETLETSRFLDTVEEILLEKSFPDEGQGDSSKSGVEEDRGVMSEKSMMEKEREVTSGESDVEDAEGDSNEKNMPAG